MLHLYELIMLSQANSLRNKDKVNILKDVKGTSAFLHFFERWPQDFVCLVSTEYGMKLPPQKPMDRVPLIPVAKSFK